MNPTRIPDKPTKRRLSGHLEQSTEYYEKELQNEQQTRRSTELIENERSLPTTSLRHRRRSLPVNPVSHRSIEIKHNTELSIEKNALLFRSITLADGTSVAELNKYHRVGMIGLHSISSQVLHDVIMKFVDSHKRVLMTNTVLVIAHECSENTMRTYLKKHSVPHESILFAKISETQHKGLLALKAKQTEAQPTIRSIVKNIFSKPQANADACIFTWENGAIVRELQLDHLEWFEHFDVYMSKIKPCTGYLAYNGDILAEIKKRFPHLKEDFLSEFWKLYSQFTEHEKQQDFKDTMIMKELYDVLETDTKRVYFERFAISQNCVEGILFHEDVRKFKWMVNEQERLKKAWEIIEMYLKSGSLHQINTKEALVKKIQFIFSGNEVPPTLFDTLLRDMICNTLIDVFARFKMDVTYDIMNVAERVVNSKQRTVVYK
jgi:hypothetical protein